MFLFILDFLGQNYSSENVYISGVGAKEKVSLISSLIFMKFADDFHYCKYKTLKVTRKGDKITTPQHSSNL